MHAWQGAIKERREREIERKSISHSPVTTVLIKKERKKERERGGESKKKTDEWKLGQPIRPSESRVPFQKQQQSVIISASNLVDDVTFSSTFSFISVCPIIPSFPEKGGSYGYGPRLIQPTSPFSSSQWWLWIKQTWATSMPIGYQLSSGPLWLKDHDVKIIDSILIGFNRWINGWDDCRNWTSNSLKWIMIGW